MALNNFINQDVEWPNRFTIVADGDGNGTSNDPDLEAKVIILEFTPGGVTANGTPLSAFELNKLITQINANDVAIVGNDADILTNFNAIALRVLKVAGKELSENDYVNADKAKVDFITVIEAVDLNTIVSDITATELVANAALPKAGGIMSGNISMITDITKYKITDMADPTLDQDATTKKYVDTQDALKLNLTGGTLSGALAMGTNKITGLTIGTADGDAVNVKQMNILADNYLLLAGGIMSGALAMGTNKITGLADGSADGDAVNVGQINTFANSYLLKAGGTMSGPLVMGTNKITGLGDPTLLQDAATKIYVDGVGNLKLPKTGGTMSGAIAMGTSKITGLGDPTLDQDAATLHWVNERITTAQIGEITGDFSLLDPEGIIRHKLVDMGDPLTDYDGTHKKYVDDADALKLNLTGGTLGGALAMGTNKITGLGNPTLAQDAATMSWTETQVSTLGDLKLSLTGGTMEGIIDLGDYRLVNVGIPAVDGDAVPKSYVDSATDLKLNLAGGIMSGVLNMGSQKITSLLAGTLDGDAIRKDYVDGIDTTLGLLISGNTTSIGTNEDDIATNIIAIGLNTAKTGITGTQASNITTNNGKISYNSTVADAALPRAGGTMTGNLIGPEFHVNSAGSASDPGFTYSTNTNTGMFFPATDQLGFSAGGIEMMRLVEGTTDYIDMKAHSLRGVKEIRYNNTAPFRILYDTGAAGTGDPDNYTGYTAQDGDIWIEY